MRPQSKSSHARQTDRRPRGGGGGGEGNGVGGVGPTTGVCRLAERQTRIDPRLSVSGDRHEFTDEGAAKLLTTSQIKKDLPAKAFHLAPFALGRTPASGGPEEVSLLSLHRGRAEVESAVGHKGCSEPLVNDFHYLEYAVPVVDACLYPIACLYLGRRLRR